MDLNATHDPSRSSWIGSANGDTDFPVQNLPFGRFRRAGAAPAIGVAIGDQILDLSAARGRGLFSGDALVAATAAEAGDLLPLLRLGRRAASPLRLRLFELLCAGGDEAGRAAADAILVPQDAVEMLLPVVPRQFSDMCVSTFHIGRRRGTDDAGQPICPPMFRALPVGYDGRASSVVVSGTPVVRPNGQWAERIDGGEIRFGPEPRLDYELEVGVWLGGEGNALGRPLSLTEAREAIWGFTLLNDWSARGIQLFEMMLGPFLGKSLATTVSPWIVTAEALAPFAAPAFARPATDPAAPRHLLSAEDQRAGGYDIALSARLATPEQGAEATVCRTDFRHMYWTVAQMIAHHASNGCGLRAGDLIGSGTCSGPEAAAAACLWEANLHGPLAIAPGVERSWLEDGDTLILTGRAAREGFVAIGFGEARGTVQPAPPWPYDPA